MNFQFLLLFLCVILLIHSRKMNKKASKYRRISSLFKLREGDEKMEDKGPCNCNLDCQSRACCRQLFGCYCTPKEEKCYGFCKGTDDAMYHMEKHLEKFHNHKFEEEGEKKKKKKKINKFQESKSKIKTKRSAILIPLSKAKERDED